MYELQRKLSWSALKTGWVITTALLILFLTVFFSGNIGHLFSPRVKLYGQVENVKGLRTGAPVWLSGVEIGTVDDIILTPEGATIILSIMRKHFHLISSDADIRVLTMGVLGDRFIEIDNVAYKESKQALEGNGNGTALHQARPGDTLYGKSPVDFDQIVESGASTFNTFDTLMANLEMFIEKLRNGQGTVNELISNPELYDRMNEAARTITAAAREIRTAEGSIRQFLHDPELYENLNRAARNLSALTSSIDTGNGLAGTLLNDPALSREIFNTIRNVNELLADIRKQPRKYFNFKLF
jgi:phospholipid/cholesterol/gamma-HCH transport system substrate-binding protein